jgi:hypothetical protein
MAGAVAPSHPVILAAIDSSFALTVEVTTTDAPSDPVASLYSTPKLAVLIAPFFRVVHPEALKLAAGPLAPIKIISKSPAAILAGSAAVIVVLATPPLVVTVLAITGKGAGAPLLPLLNIVLNIPANITTTLSRETT